MKIKLSILCAVAFVLALVPGFAAAQCSGGAGAQTGLGSVSCTGVPAWTGQAVAAGASVTYNNCLYKANQAISANPVWCPGCAGIYLYGNGAACPAAGCNYGAQGTCGGSATPTPTAPPRSTPTPTSRSRATATATSPRPTATSTTPPSNGFPARFTAPYVATWNSPNLGSLATSTGNKYWTLAFIINGGGTCNPLWNGDTSLSTTYNVAGLRSQGGDVIASFGGASGTEIAASCTDVASTQAAYQKVINAMSLKAIDLDIESGFENDTASIDRRNKAMKNLQAANPGLRVDYTLAVDRAGLPSAQINLLKNAASNGVVVSSVNIMAMDYGPCYSDMGQAAVDAANATKNQLAANGLNMKVGVTPMIGVNDVSCENFTTNDANVLVSYAQGQSYINLLAYWVQDADSSHSYINIFKTFH